MKRTRAARVRGAAAVTAALLVAAALAGCSEILLPVDPPAAAAPAQSGGGAAPESSSGATTTGAPGTALALLATLPVEGRAPKTGYARTADFGTAWLDVDRNGCDTRDDVLRRDLVSPVGSGCHVLRGTLHDPYTGRVIAFVRGVRTSTAVQIDHVVALSEAWQTGARKLTQGEREALANDPVNLFAVDGPTNESKGDGDAATWLPPNKAFRCTYVAHQVAVKAAYHLWVTRAERDAITRVLARCPDQRAPADTLAEAVAG